jgi:hypothetical protein
MGDGMNTRKLGVTCGLAIAIAMSASAAFALGPIGPQGPSPTAQQDLLDVSFFGRPYPYGFTGWGPCTRYVEVETRRGPRLRRVWICR